MFRYKDENNNTIESSKHFLTIKEICDFFYVRKGNSTRPLKLMKEFITEELQLKPYRYFYIPGLRYIFVYNIYPFVDDFSILWQRFLNKKGLSI